MFGPLTATQLATPALTFPSTSKKSTDATTKSAGQSVPRRSVIDAHLQLSADGLVPSPTYEDTRVKGMVKHVAGLLSERVSDPQWIAKEFAEQIAKVDSFRFSRVSALCIKDSRRNWRVKKNADGTVLSLTYQRNLSPFSKWNIITNVLILLSWIVDGILRLVVGPDFRVQLTDDCAIVESRVNGLRISVPRH